MTDPVLFVLDDDPGELTAFERVLRRRYGADYRVIAERSPEAGLERLGQLASHGEDVALVVADQWLPGTTGVDFLARAHELHPHARRALFVAPGDVAADEALVGAMVLGRLDYYLSKHWDPPDEYLFPVISELLADWYRATRRSTHTMVRVVGRRWDARSHALRDLLERNAVPYAFYDAESEEGRALLRALGQDGSRLPVVTTYDGRLLVDPSNGELAAAMGARTRPGPELYDLVIVGAGPAGISAAVYGASEGLRTLVLEPEALGGQAGTSAMIRNYLGFPHGISGGMLMSRASRQAMLFGAEFVYNRAAGLARRGRTFVVRLVDGGEAVGRAVLVATGVSYRRLGVPELDGLLGAGVFYGAALSEAHAMRGQEVYVVGAGNSAGQARGAGDDPRAGRLLGGEHVGLPDQGDRRDAEHRGAAAHAGGSGRRHGPAGADDARGSGRGSDRGGARGRAVRPHRRRAAHRLAGRDGGARRVRLPPDRRRPGAGRAPRPAPGDEPAGGVRGRGRPAGVGQARGVGGGGGRDRDPLRPRVPGRTRGSTCGG